MTSETRHANRVVLAMVSKRVWDVGVLNLNLQRAKISDIYLGATWRSMRGATLRGEFYEGIYMSAIFYRPLNARSRSVPQWARRPTYESKCALKISFSSRSKERIRNSSRESSLEYLTRRFLRTRFLLPATRALDNKKSWSLVCTSHPRVVLL